MPSSVKVYPKPNENIGKTARRFKKLCQREGIIRDFRKHVEFEKPSAKKRRKALRSLKMRQKMIAEGQVPQQQYKHNDPSEDCWADSVMDNNRPRFDRESNSTRPPFRSSNIVPQQVQHVSKGTTAIPRRKRVVAKISS